MKKSIFLIDGLGAFLSTLFLFFITHNEIHFGMPKVVVFKLIPITTLFAIYSFICHYKKVKNSPIYLSIIAICNFLYCIATLFLLFFNFEKLTKLGVGYFVLEIVIIILLASFEIKVALEKPSSP
jgi:hypothetical protein